MVDIFTGIKERIPHSMKNSLKGTVIEDIYRHEIIASLRGRTVDVELVAFESPVGQFELYLPHSAGPYAKRNSPGGYEPGLIESLADEFYPKTVYYDVGAGYGYNCVLAEACGVKPENTHGFEADPFRYPILRRNVSRASKMSKVFVDKMSEENCITLDDYLSQSTVPDIVTVDVEGAEYDVLQGSQRLLDSEKPVLYIEVHPERLPHHSSIADLFEFLRSYEYELSAKDHRSIGTEWQRANSTDLPLNKSTESPTCMLRAR